MKLFLYVQILVLIFINSLLFAASLGGTVIIDNNDHFFNFNGKTLTIEDAGNTFGSVTVTSTGSFVFPNKVNDNKSHAYSIKLIQKPDTTQYRCTVINNKVTGIVYIYDNNDIVISCKGKYYVSVNVTGLSSGDTYALADNNQTLLFDTNSTKTFDQWYYANFTYSFKPIFKYNSLDYKKCSNNTNGTITNNLSIYIVCNTSTFNSVDLRIPARLGAVSWTDSLGNVYVFGGNNGNIYYNDLWKLNGSSWSLLIDNGVAGSPNAISGAVAWTDNSGNAYVFGGENMARYYNDLWKFNGKNWSQVTNAGTPPSTRKGAVAWVDNSGNAYVFGGFNGANFNDLWRFDGTRWYRVIANNVAGSPSRRIAAASWKDNSGNAYVFGGYNGTFLNDLWEFDGTSWSPVNNGIGTPPSIRTGSASWTDSSGNAYVFGGFYANNESILYYNDLWRFDGTSWSQIIANGALSSPNIRKSSLSWTDSSGNAYIFGGYNGSINYNDLWKFNGTNWLTLINVVNAPNGRDGRVSWTDSSGNAYVFGGVFSYAGSSVYYNDLWRFNGTSYSQVIDNGAASSPSVRNNAVAWTDNAGNAYVFGGYNGVNYLNDLWKFNGTTWSVVTNDIGTAPSSRASFAAWTDSYGNAYIFGGYNGSIYLNDFWKFNGTTWSVVTNVIGAPPSNRGYFAAWTDNSGNAYIFGGYNGAAYLNDLWKFDGHSWSPVTDGIGITPGIRKNAVAWTDNAGNAYIFGGYNGSTYLNDLWKFNGRSWSQVTNGIGTVPGTREGAVSWTDSSGKVYLFGGFDNISYYNDLYII